VQRRGREEKKIDASSRRHARKKEEEGKPSSETHGAKLQAAQKPERDERDVRCAVERQLEGGMEGRVSYRLRAPSQRERTSEEGL